jgi:hypothetical protein
MRSALKERQKTPDVAAYRHPRELCGLYCSASHGFLRSFRATRFFTIPRVPPSLHPGLSSCTPSAFSTFPCFCRFQPVPKADISFRGQRSLFNVLLTNHFAAMQRVFLLRLFLSDGKRNFHRKNASGSPPSTAITCPVVLLSRSDNNRK